MNNSINIDIYREKKNFNGYFKKLLTANLSDNYLDKVMLYSALNGGKRIRPYLVKQFSLLKNVKYLHCDILQHLHPSMTSTYVHVIYLVSLFVYVA